MADPGAAAEARSGALRFLTFRMGERLYALPAEEVAEVIRIPAVARLPQAPKGLMGLANLRGSVLPVASLRGLLGEGTETGAASRAVVLDGASPVALAVDSVEALVSVEADRVETAPAKIVAEPGERLRGAFRTAGDGPVARVLDVAALLETAFARTARPERRTGAAAAGRFAAEGPEAEAAVEKLVTFDVAGQEFALPLGAVQEVITAPETVAAVPRAEAVVLGVAAHRDALLPLLSLRSLLGFPATAADGREKVLVTSVGGVLVGLVADRMRAIMPADPACLEPTPPMLAARTGGESRIKAIYRAEGGRRLISILSPDQLFREDVMQRLGGDAGTAQISAASDATTARQLQVLVFRLGEDEFGLPIDVVDEVARAPEKVTRVPKTPKFLEGVINLRGEVLPVVDQRRRFDMPPLEAAEGRRLVVVRTERHRAGLIVDSVSEVLRTSEDAIEPAPHLAGEITRLVHGVVNLEEAGRMILLLDPAELLTRAERGLLDAFQTDVQAAP
ncbi:chemotaxis protein CheW [Phenylobacterium sp.]|uniref:chemotaxis protein CheW n=1 Tax=Phenylobacterium sp. TaxID=1871053 RepID=UPI002BE48630|nr:chemotaxis protein CheW [Phenylobacterium sp.]HVI33868.1 chemotaxis protein CheW [Phenylobacterium sp.]